MIMENYASVSSLGFNNHPKCENRAPAFLNIDPEVNVADARLGGTTDRAVNVTDARLGVPQTGGGGGALISAPSAGTRRAGSA